MYECTLANQKIKLPWKKLSQKETEKVFGRVVGTYSAGQPGALPKWLLKRFPKIKWQLDNEGNLQVDLYLAAYTCLCLDLTIISTASRRIEVLPIQERHIVGYVLGGLEKMDKTEVTLDILQKLVVESGSYILKYRFCLSKTVFFIFFKLTKHPRLHPTIQSWNRMLGQHQRQNLLIVCVQ